MAMLRNRQGGLQTHQELEDEMSRFEEEISGHTIDRPIIASKQFYEANQTIHDGHGTAVRHHPGNLGHNQDPQFMTGYPPGGVNRGDGELPLTPHLSGFPSASQSQKHQVNMPPHVHQEGLQSQHQQQHIQSPAVSYHPAPNQQFPVQQVPFPIPPMPPQIPSHFHSGMQQNIIGGMVPLVPMQVPSRQKAPVEHVSITPEQKREWESAYGNNDMAGGKAKKKDKKFVRVAGGVVWEDTSLADWDPNDFRIFVGDLGNEVTDDALTRAFAKYPSFQKAKVIREKKTNKTKGYGFVSFKDSGDFIKAMREMNGKYVGNRPIKLRKSSWKDRSIDVVKKKMKEKKKLGLR